MSNIILTAYAQRSDARERASETIEALASHGLSASFFTVEELASVSLQSTDVLVSLGGDGTFLRTSRWAHRAGARVLPVDLGRVGFLLDVPVSEITTRIVAATTADLTINRIALTIAIDEDPESHFALNEVVVERSHAGRMVRVQTSIDEEEYLTYSADAVMVSTPTGSTAYNFSAGGPVVDPALSVLILTPVAPHFTIDRSIVVGDQRTIRLTAVDRSATVTADGEVIGSLEPGSTLRVTKSPRPVRVIYSGALDLGNRLRVNLREGHA